MRKIVYTVPIMASFEMVIKAVQSADDGIYVTDRDGTIIYANNAVARILGCNDTDLIGRSTSVFHSGVMPHEYYARLWTTVLSGHVWRELITNRRFNGEHYEASQTITPIVGENGAITMMIAVQRDLTQQHRELEREVSTAQTDLEAELIRRDTMLRELNHRVKNDFLLVASMLHLQAADSGTEEIAEELRSAAGRIQVLSEMYQMFQFPGKREAVPLPDFIEELLDFWKSTVLPPSVVLHREVTDRSISGDLAIALGIAANELIANAVKYGLTNGSDLRIAIRTEEHDPAILSFEVCDSGTGLPEEVLSRESLGLGLSVVRSLAEQHGGTLRMTNTDSGACVGIGVQFERAR